MTSATHLMSALNASLQAAVPATSSVDNFSCASTNESARETGQDVMFSGLSIIIPCGLILNVLSLLVFMSRAMRRRASSWYLAALAASDSLSLLAVSFEYWLKDNRIGLQVMGKSAVACVTVSHLSYAGRLLSAWLVTTFTVERFIGVFYPLRRSLIISISHARRVILTETIVCIALAGFTPFTVGIVNNVHLDRKRPDCDVLPEMVHVYKSFNVAFGIIGSIVAPILIIVTLNLAIFRRVRRCASRRNELDAISSEERPSPPTGGSARHYSFSLYCRHHHNHHNQQQEHQRRQRTGGSRQREYNMTILLLVVSTTFVVLNVPYCISWFTLFFYRIDFVASTPTCRFIDILFAIKYIAFVPYCLNYGINFALYSVCARTFRGQLLRVLSTSPICRRFCHAAAHRQRDIAHGAHPQPAVFTPRAPRLRHVVAQHELHELHRRVGNEQARCECHLPDMS